MKKKLAIIGCGGIGTYHLGHFLGFTDIIELAGFCDLIPERAESFVKKAGSGKAYTDYLEMYDEVKPDMVFICIPPYCHGEIEFETIRRGIPFFVEKPLALDLDLARRIRDAAEEKNLITASGFQCRYSKLVAPNVEFCKNNEIVFIDCTRIGGVPGVFWWKDKDLSGGQIVEQTIHQFDIIRYVFGEPEEVCTYGTRGFVKGIPDYNTDDCSVTIVKFQNGTIGTISTGDYAKTGNSFDSKIIFSAADKRAELKILGTFEVFGVQREHFARTEHRVPHAVAGPKGRLPVPRPDVLVGVRLEDPLPVPRRVQVRGVHHGLQRIDGDGQAREGRARISFSRTERVPRGMRSFIACGRILRPSR